MDMTTNGHNATTEYAASVGTPMLSSVEHFVFAVLHFSLSVLIVFGNTLTILAIFRFPELRTQPHIFVFNLAVADAVVGVCVFLLGLMLTDSAGQAFRESAHLCVFIITLLIVCCSQSLVTLTTMAVDRLVNVVYPYHHARFFTERRTKIGVGLFWLLSVAEGFLVAFSNVFTPERGCKHHAIMQKAVERFFIPTAVLVDIIITSACYAKIASVARKHRKAISAQIRVVQHVQTQEELSNETQSTRRTSREANSEHPATSRGNLNQQTNRSDGTKSVGLFVTVNCLFALCWIPLVIHCFLRGMMQSSHTTSLVHWIFLLAMSNSAMNAVILACKNKHFARAYRALLTKQSSCCKNESN